MTNHLVGRVSESAGYGFRARACVSIRLEPVDPRPRFDVWHNELDPAGEYLRLSITGGVINRNSSDYMSCGQNTDNFRGGLAEYAPGWTREDRLSLVLIWDRWHLNDMRAACAHMDAATLVREPDNYGGTRIACGRANTCAVSGYTYGAAWLFEPLPADVLAEIRRLQALPTGNLPEWVR